LARIALTLCAQQVNHCLAPGAYLRVDASRLLQDGDNPRRIIPLL
jgi:hypothetical protein